MDYLKILKSQLESESLSHAYLIFGNFEPEKIAKILQVSQSDLMILEETPIKINHIRGLIHWLALKPHSSLQKLAVLWGIENLTLDAANALLKNLEEPPAKSLIILQALRKERILPTIISRCQVIRQKKSPPPDLPKNYLSPRELSKRSIRDRFEYVKKLVEKENLANILNCWESDFRHELSGGKDVLRVLKEINRARSLLSTNISVKLLLENLILEF